MMRCLLGHRWTGPNLLQQCTRCKKQRTNPAPVLAPTAWPLVTPPPDDLTTDLAGAGEAPNPAAFGLEGTEGGYLLPGTVRKERHDAVV